MPTVQQAWSLEHETETEGKVEKGEHCKVERREEEGKVEKEGEEGKKDKDRSALARVSCSIAITIPLLDLSLCNH